MTPDRLAVLAALADASAALAAARSAALFAALIAGASQAQEEEGRAAAPAPRCEGMAEGARCWQQLAGKPGCRVWTSYYGDVTLAWSGRCSGGIATGSGKLTGRWPGGGGAIEAVGKLRGGRCHGRWTYRIWGGKVLGGERRGVRLRGRRAARPAADPLARRDRRGRPLCGRRAARAFVPALAQRLLHMDRLRPRRGSGQRRRKNMRPNPGHRRWRWPVAGEGGWPAPGVNKYASESDASPVRAGGGRRCPAAGCDGG